MAQEHLRLATYFEQRARKTRSDHDRQRYARAARKYRQLASDNRGSIEGKTGGQRQDSNPCLLSSHGAD
jgi:hypothetical protein